MMSQERTNDDIGDCAHPIDSARRLVDDMGWSALMWLLAIVARERGEAYTHGVLVAAADFLNQKQGEDDDG